MHTRVHAWTHIPIQTQVTLFEADGSHEEFPLGIERGGDKKQTREGSGGGGVRRRQGGWGEGEKNCSTCLDRMHSEGGADGGRGWGVKMPWS